MTDQSLKAGTAATGTFAIRSSATTAPTATGNSVSGGGTILPLKGLGNAELSALAEKLNLTTHSIGRELRFEVDIDRRHAVIQVINRETGEIIREIPPEKASVSVSHNGELEIRLLDSRV